MYSLLSDINICVLKFIFMCIIFGNFYFFYFVGNRVGTNCASIIDDFFSDNYRLLSAVINSEDWGILFGFASLLIFSIENLEFHLIFIICIAVCGFRGLPKNGQ